MQDNWDDIKPEGAGDEITVGVIGWANAFGAGATTPESLAFAESLGITVLPQEEQPIDPSADVTGQLQNLLVNGANVIYMQSSRSASPRSLARCTPSVSTIRWCWAA